MPTIDAAEKVLPNHDIVALANLPQGHRMTLSAFTEHASERAWRLSMTSLLAAAENGRHPDKLLRFLNRTVDHALPEKVSTLIADAAARTSTLTDPAWCGSSNAPTPQWPRCSPATVRCPGCASASATATSPRTSNTEPPSARS
jgi:hypothetical protein